MKKNFTLLFVFSLLTLATTANTIIVKGYVKDANGKAIANKPLFITTDSVGNLASCSVNHYKYTNNDGFYIDTITCNSDIKKVKIATANCTGAIIYNTAEVSVNNIVESNFTICVVTPPPPPPPAPTCNAAFTYNAQGLDVKFNGGISTGDSIISRAWSFGDSSYATTGDPIHSYAKAGVYNVCLKIKTAKGCESTSCANVVVTSINITCLAQFTAEKIAPKKMRFNSSASFSMPGDSIIKRSWKFGDGTVLNGNEISPSKEFLQQGVYTVCLSTTTAKGCTNEVCKTIVLQDSTAGTPPVSNVAIKIISINPNPVTTRMLVTVWCANSNTDVELGISDIYGFKRWTSKKTLLQGNNIIEISTSFLNSGPYFLKVGSKYGTLSRGFYKL